MWNEKQPIFLVKKRVAQGEFKVNLSYISDT